MYKFFIFSPNNEKIILAIIYAAAKAGAGIIRNYTHCLFW